MITRTEALKLFTVLKERQVFEFKLGPQMELTTSCVGLSVNSYGDHHIMIGTPWEGLKVTLSGWHNESGVLTIKKDRFNVILEVESDGVTHERLEI